METAKHDRCGLTMRSDEACSTYVNKSWWLKGSMEVQPSVYLSRPPWGVD
jgi:hypothetical protein